MSVTAISWAAKQSLPRSSQKFVLVMLANYADEQGCCYPSVERLCADTCQDRKTVLESISRLKRAGLVEDTGRRVGRTRSVPVYRLIGISGKETWWCVYRLTRLETGEFYIGTRHTAGEPEFDSYRGSGAWCLEMERAGVSLTREVLARYTSKEEALSEEARLFRLHGPEPLNRNRGTPHALAKLSKESLKRACLSSPENGAVPKTEQSQFSGEAVPKTEVSGPVYPSEQSQKRDTDPSADPFMEPSVQPPTRARGVEQRSTIPNSTVIPLLLNTPEFRAAWVMWLEHLKQKRKSPSLHAQDLQLRRLATFGPEKAVVTLHHSIEHNWQGIYEQRSETDQRYHKPTPSEARNANIVGADPTGGKAAGILAARKALAAGASGNGVAAQVAGPGSNAP